MEKLGLVSVTTAMLAFVVNLLILVQKVGVALIVSPTAVQRPTTSDIQGSILGENISLLILFCMLIAMVVAYFWLWDHAKINTPGLRFWLVLSLFFALLPAMVVIWLWGFAHISAQAYIAQLPISIFLGFVLWGYVGMEGYKNSGDKAGLVAFILPVFFWVVVIVWVRSVTDGNLWGAIFSALFYALIGGLSGYTIGFFLIRTYEWFFR